MILKHVPEDFRVFEIPVKKLTQERMQYSYWVMHKRSYTTSGAVSRISSALGIPSKFIGFAGNKDKHAVTEQVISIKGTDKGKIESLELKDIELKFQGYSNEHISLGELKGNKFEIVVRDIISSPSKKEQMLNLFGEQRFSTNNAAIGKAMIKKNFEEAVRLLLEGRGRQEEIAADFLSDHPNDFVGALRTIPKRILRIFVNSYQSLLWNECAIAYRDAGIEKKTIPFIGFDMYSTDSVISKIMEREEISERDFIVREIPEVSAEGGDRSMYVQVNSLEISDLEDDDQFEGRKKVTLWFWLPKGSYATVAIDQLFESS